MWFQHQVRQAQNEARADGPPCLPGHLKTRKGLPFQRADECREAAPWYPHLVRARGRSRRRCPLVPPCPNEPRRSDPAPPHETQEPVTAQIRALSVPRAGLFRNAHVTPRRSTAPASPAFHASAETVKAPATCV